jgi:2-methylcitrate dehydratase
MSVAGELARYTLDTRFEDIPEDVLRQTRYLVLDTLGCAIGGFRSDAAQALLQYVNETTSAEEATIYGTGIKTSCLNAALVNGCMVRFLDYNDTGFIIEAGTYKSTYHPSEIIPGVLILGEYRRVTGKKVIETIVAGYDLSSSFFSAIKIADINKIGWSGDVRGAYVMPVIAGKLLGLNQEQIENAVGIAGSCHAVLNILDSPAEVYTMTKNIRFPMMTYASIMAARMAEKGFTGPARIVEGNDGFADVVMRDDFDANKWANISEKYSIRNACIKSIIADFSSHGHITATMMLARENDIKPEDVEEVVVRTSERCAEHTGDPAKKYPTTKENADHSSYYLTAIAIVDKQVGPDQFQPEKYADPRVIELIGKVKLVGDPSLNKVRPAGISEITLKNGQKFTKRVDYPRGHVNNPMTEDEIIAKFFDMAEKHMSKSRIDRIVDTVFHLEDLSDVSEIAKLMVFE